MAISLLDKTNTGLMFLDVQERLMRVMRTKQFKEMLGIVK